MVLYPLAPFGVSDTAEPARPHPCTADPPSSRTTWCSPASSLAALAVPVAVHAVATRLADRDSRPGILTPARQALLATACAMATAAILVALFTVVAIALLPHQVPDRPADGDGICPTCEPSTVVIPPNLRHEYYAEAASAVRATARRSRC